MAAKVGEVILHILIFFAPDFFQYIVLFCIVKPAEGTVSQDFRDL